MIREIINFSEFVENKIEIENYIEPQQEGLFVVVSDDAPFQQTTNNNDKENWTISDDGLFQYTYYKKGNEITPLLKECILKLQYSWTIEYDKKPWYQKCFDLPNKRIHSVSPFLVAVKRKYLDGGIEFKPKKVDLEYIQRYLNKAEIETLNNSNNNIAESFKSQLSIIFNNLIEVIKKHSFQKESYVIIAFNTSIKHYKASYDNYLKLKVFNSSSLGLTDTQGNVVKEKDALSFETIHGWSNFFNGYNAEKPFLRHQTSISATNRITNKDARLLYKFKEYLRLGLFPNPLPIFVDIEEILPKDYQEGQTSYQSEIIKIYNDQKNLSFKDIVKEIFKNYPASTLQKYYLLYVERGEICDFDFIPLFRYRFDNTLMIENVTGSGFVNDGVFEKDTTERIDNVFDFERIVVCTIFNNSLVKIKNGEYKTKYFGDIVTNENSGGALMWQLIMKYRKAFYDYIYKSRKNAITTYMFDDMMLTSILTNIRIDDINTRCEYNNAIKKKINIWFSIYYLFNNNKKETIMASHVTDLLSKMEAVAKGKSNIDSPEEFAFAAGQLASYLIDRSVASNKSYAMLEPYLQKCKSGQLEDAIAQTIAMYKHDISTYKGNFKMLSAQVLTYDNNVDLKPLLKYFLAGCFSHCVIYETNENNNQ